MIFCPKCNKSMIHVYRFSPDKSCELYICRNCHFETKPKRIKFNGLEIKQDNAKDKQKRKVKDKVKEKVKKKNDTPKKKNNKNRKKGKKK